MANEIKLEVYTFGIRDLNSLKEKQSYKTLNSFSDNDDFFDFFTEYVASLDLLELNEYLQKAIKLKPKSLHTASKDRNISGYFESGGYGIESDIYSTATQKKSYSKKKDDVDILPFYFLIGIPKDRNVGIIIVERIGIFGISTILKDSLTKFLRAQHIDLIIDFQPLISKELARSFIEEGGVKEIILRKYKLPEDKAEKLTMKKYATQILSIELRIKAKNIFKNFNGEINRYLKDTNATFFDIPELRRIGFEDGVKYSIVSKLDGTSRTIDLTDTMQIRPYYDIDKDVKKENSGHSKYDSIHKIAKGLLDELMNELPKR